MCFICEDSKICEEHLKEILDGIIIRNDNEPVNGFLSVPLGLPFLFGEI